MAYLNNQNEAFSDKAQETNHGDFVTSLSHKSNSISQEYHTLKNINNQHDHLKALPHKQSITEKH